MTSPEVFFTLVDRHVTGPMEAAGYAKIGEYDHLSNRVRAVPLVSARSRWLPIRPRFRKLRRPRERVLQVGFEGLDQEGESDEKWIDYFPKTGELTLGGWWEALEKHADWDALNNRAVTSTEELERRPSMAGASMRGRANG